VKNANNYSWLPGVTVKREYFK